MFQFDARAFKAYDIRGLYPEQVNEPMAHALGRAYARHFRPRRVAVGRDVRLSSPALQEALISGLLSAGVDVTDLGLISTEMLYFAVGGHGYDGGIVVTASHNPAGYNGFKMVRAGAVPVSWETGLEALSVLVAELLHQDAPPCARGQLAERSYLAEYREFLHSFVDPSCLVPMRVVANANFGLQGQFAGALLEGLPVTLSLLNGEPDGSFPKGQPDPFLPSNRAEFIQKVADERPAFGVTWDADGDRVFFATGEGRFLEAYHTAALLAGELLRKYPGAPVVYDVRYTWAILDAVRNAGGVPIPSRVGHSYIKQALRQHQAVFCGEASGHIYFRDYFHADTGLLPFLLVLELLSRSGKTLEELITPFVEAYHVSGEINSQVANPQWVLQGLRRRYSDAPKISELDGLTVEFGRAWRFNVRTSNTEPLLRLNVEACSQPLMEARRDELLACIHELSPDPPEAPVH